MPRTQSFPRGDEWRLVSGVFTARPGDFLYVIGEEAEGTLPANPSRAARIEMADLEGTWADFPPVIHGNGKLIEFMGPSAPSPSNSVTLANGSTVVFTFDEEGDVWRAQYLAGSDTVVLNETVVVSDQFADGSSVTDTIGISGAPQTGNNLGANTYVIAPPAKGDGWIGAMRGRCNNAGDIQFRIFDKSGNTLARDGGDTAVTLPLNDFALDPTDFGKIRILKGQFPGFYNPVSGRIAFVPGTITQRHWFMASGDQTTFDDSTVSTSGDLQFGVDYVYDAVDIDRMDAVEARVSNLISDTIQNGTVRIGVPATPATTSVSSGADGVYTYEDALPCDGDMTRVVFSVAAATTVLVYFSDKVVVTDFDLDHANVRSFTVGAAGAYEFTSANGDFVALPGKEGQHVSFYSDGNVQYYLGGEPYSGGHYRTAANVTYQPNPSLVSGSGPRLQFGVDVTVGPGYPLPLATDGATLSRLHAKLATKLNAGTGIIRVGIIGDSWTERPAIPAALKGLLTAAYGESGYGWISVDGTNSLTGLTHTPVGWTLFDASGSSSGVPPVGVGCAVDGKAIYTSGTTATDTITVRCESFKIGYRDGDGTFRWRVDGGAWTSVPGGSTGTVSWVSITGLSDVSHTFEIDTSTNGGQVVIYNYFPRRTAAGIEFHKLGNGSIDGTQIGGYLDQMPPFWSELQLDLLVIVLGTNDSTRNLSFSTYTSALTGIVEGARVAVPDVGVILWAPANNNATQLRPLLEYAREMYRLSGATELNCEFFNHYKLFGTWADMDALGMWSDDRHVTSNGGFMASKQAGRSFFWLP